MIDIVHFKYRLQIKDPRRDDLTSELLPFEHLSDSSSAGSNFHLLYRLCKPVLGTPAKHKQKHPDVGNKL